MSFFNKPRLWLCAAACAAAFWITFRVLDADAAPRTLSARAEAPDDEVQDVALAAMIHRFAAATRNSNP